MKKYFLFLLFLSAGHLSSIAQITDSLKVDSLQKHLPYLKDSNKVDCLNLLAQKFLIIGGPTWTWSKKADSVYYYATIAYKEAKRIGYKRGVAAALTNLANSEWTKGVDLRKNKKNDSVSQNNVLVYLSQAKPLAEEVRDDETLGEIYLLWGDLLFLKSKLSDEWTEYYKKSIDHFYKAGNENREGEVSTYLGERYTIKGYYEEALEYCSRSLELNKKGCCMPNQVKKKNIATFFTSSRCRIWPAFT